MLPTFVIGLREGVEAALIISIIATFLRQEGRTDALRWVWAGVAAAAAICLTVGIVLHVVDQELPQKQQEGLETVIGAVAVVMVTFMIVWMRRNGAALAGELRANTSTALKQGSVGALIGMAFFAVFREGLETAVFLVAAFQSSDDPTTAGVGALLGILVAVAIGVLIYRGGIRLNLARFFRLTGVVLALVAAGLVAMAFHTAHEAGWINFGQDQALDLSWLVVPGTWTASLLTGMLGLQPRPTDIELIAYLAYAVPIVAFVLIPVRRRIPTREKVRGAAVATLLLVAALALVACGSDDASSGSGAAGARTVEVKLTDAGCEPAALKIDAGPTTFKVSNAGTARVTEFEVLSGSRILGEKENIAAGLSGSFTLDLKPGSYTLLCPGGTKAATGSLEVGGAAAADAGAAADPALASATASYRSYVEEQADELVERTEAFVAAIKAGDVAKAKALFARTRQPYETIEPVAESFGTLDPAIDARVNDVEEGAEWTGFHKIEHGLWQKRSTKGLAPVAERLLADVRRLQRRTEGLTYQPHELANGANGLLDEVSASKITGEEDRYSHTDLADVAANVEGSQTAFGLLAPALRKRDPRLAATIERRFEAVTARLARLKRGGAFPSYATVGPAERRRLSQLVDALAEPLSRVAARLSA